MQPFCSYDPLCAHFQSTKPSSQPKTVPYKMQWLLLFSCGKEHAFCSSPIFQLFRGRNAFCSGVFWGSKFITRCARPHFIALGRWLMEFFLKINGFFFISIRIIMDHLTACNNKQKATKKTTNEEFRQKRQLKAANCLYH